MAVFHYVVYMYIHSRLPNFHEDLNMLAMIGTSDRPCWLAEACKILLLTQLSTPVVELSNMPFQTQPTAVFRSNFL